MPAARTISRETAATAAIVSAGTRPDVAKVLDDHRINSVPFENIELQKGLVVHLLHRAVVQRRARQRQQVNDADDRFLRAKQIAEGHV
jgi:hypothetical protein